MQKWQRKFLFWTFFLIFLIVGPSLLLYSHGYRFDLEKREIVQTGGLFIKALPKQAEVYINGKFIKKTDFVFGSLFIQNLLPKKYEIEIKKEGFFSWKKNLKIKEKMVTEAKNIFLFPSDLTFELIDSGIENFYFSPDGKKIILVTKDKDGSWSLKLYELEKKAKSHLVSEKNLSSSGAKIINLEFGESDKSLKLVAGIEEKIEIFNLDFSSAAPKLTKIEKEKTDEKILSRKKNEKDLYVLDKEGNLFKNEQKINILPLPIEKETEYFIESVTKNIILISQGQDNEKTFFLFDSESGTFEKVFENGTGFAFSPDKKKMAFFSQFEIWIFFLEKEGEDLDKNTGDKKMLLRLSKGVEGIFWFNSYYLFFVSEDKIKVTETDMRDIINIAEIAKFNKPKIFWNTFDKKLYVLDKDLLYQAFLF